MKLYPWRNSTVVVTSRKCTAVVRNKGNQDPILGKRSVKYSPDYGLWKTKGSAFLQEPEHGQ